ncbi:Protein recA [Desulfurobacterium thermolithotrophum DSM 11699]|uniref:Protein RecA n=1 Tax=Desulfurobacterium thermolithotrophum (strain DSM 11699 / BSA) TaxID=868864 RepID=F0S216_DESTD|nr:recombinase RecA [Desulfurobacterium thermolithotrophum]ADY74097.1 Protein recA [Desulfurobacterium thermolithotrophum DSM 11699]
MQEERRRVLEDALRRIKKEFGEGSVMFLGEKPAEEIPAISTGSISIDRATGIGGIPRGRITEIYGPESSGKTTLALHVIANVQKEGGIAAFIDAEHALDPTYARKLGINLEELLVSQPDSGEQALEIAETLVRSGAVDVIVVDSVAALVPEAEIKGDMGDSHVGLQARLMSQALRKLTAATSRSNCALIFINQVREKIGMMGYGGPQETTTGGRALKFYASMRMDIRNIGQIKGKGDERIGHKAKIKIVKNKLAPPFREAIVEIYYGEGISKEADLLNLGEELGFVKKSGSWYSYGDIRLGQGKENARIFLKENPEIAVELEAKIMEAFSDRGA